MQFDIKTTTQIWVPIKIKKMQGKKQWEVQRVHKCMHVVYVMTMPAMPSINTCAVDSPNSLEVYQSSVPQDGSTVAGSNKS